MKLGKLKKVLCCITACAIMFTGCSASNANNSDNNVHKDNTNIVVGIPQDIDSLDPHKSSATGTQEIMFNVFTGLMSPSPSGEVIPEIAESYTSNEDMTVYTFKLRKNVKFHNGQDLTARDVKYSFDRVCGKTKDQNKALSSIYENIIDSVNVIDIRNIEFKLTAPDPSFLTKMTLAIIPENTGLKQEKDPVGAGPYKFVKYTPGISVELTKNNDYYIEGQPIIENAEFKIFTDMNAAVMSLTNREIDYMNVTEDYLPQISENGFNIKSYSMNTVQLLALNNDFGPFKDIRVRKAINYAVDKDTLISMVSKSSPKLGSNFSSVMSAFYKEGLEKLYEYNPDRAKKLLKEAGYENLKFTCRVASEYKFNLEAAQIIKEQLRNIGVEMDLDVIDWNTWLQEVYKNKQHEATVIGFTGKLDPYRILHRYVSDYSKNFINFRDEKYDEVLKEALSEVDLNKRVNLYKEAQSILAEQAASVFLMDPSYNIVMDKNLQGYKFYPINFIDLRTLEFK